MSTPTPANAPKILVVDDQPVNVKLLEFKLQREGMGVVVAFNGKECLEKIHTEHPDLVLLDIMMPDVDGMEVCRQIRDNPESQDIPVIFITAKSTKEGKIAGLQAGADDYITKPIDLDETLARIKTQLRIRENHQVNLDLQNRLAEARQNAVIGSITQGIAHNLNNLLGVVIGYLDLTKSSYNAPEKVLRSCNLMEQALKRMTKIIRQLTTLSNTESLRLSPIPLETLLNNAITRFRNDYNKPDVKVSTQCHQNGLTIHANAEAMEDSIGRLLINAWESYPANATERPIHIHTETSPDRRNLYIYIEDEGKGVDPALESHVFEPFVSSDTAVGRGLGLTIARHHTRRLGGEITLEPKLPTGTRARLLLPAHS